MERAASETRDTELLWAPTLGEMIPLISPTFANPHHLAPFLDVLDRAPHGRLRVVFAGPPRHAKTEAVAHSVARNLVRDPTLPMMYLTYGQKLAYSKSRRMRSLALRAGVRLGKDTRGKGEWLTPEEGGMRAAGLDGDVIGHGCNVLFGDDLHKDRAEAESQLMRDHAWQQFEMAARTRLEPDGSVILFMQRWNDDDCAARAIRLGYDYINLPAIDESGRALWPERYSLADLLAIKAAATAYDWASQYLGNPQPRSGRVFADPILCDARDVPMGRTAKGVDLAHTATTRSDFQACVVMTLGADGIFWIHDVRNRRAKLVVRREDGMTDTDFAAISREGFVVELRDVHVRYPGPIGMYVARQENALLELIATMPGGVAIEQRRITSDKWERSQAFATACEQGRVRIVRDQPWTASFCSQLASFTGKGDAHDDMIDAAACAFDMLCEGAGLTVLTPSMRDRAEREGPRRSSSGRKLYT